MSQLSPIPGEPSALLEENKDGFTVYRHPSHPDLWPLICDFRVNIEMGTVLSDWHPDRRVVKVEYGGTQYVLKWLKDGSSRWEKKIQEKLHGPFYPRLMQQVVMARRLGCDVIQEIFLVAERLLPDGARETYIVLEYIHGKPVSSGTECISHRCEVAAAFEKLHSYKLALGDVNYKNLILVGNVIKIIDLSARGFFRLGRIKDAVRIRMRYGIRLPVRGFFDHILYWFVLIQHQAFYRVRLLRNTKTNPLRPRVE